MRGASNSPPVLPTSATTLPAMLDVSALELHSVDAQAAATLREIAGALRSASSSLAVHAASMAKDDASLMSALLLRCWALAVRESADTLATTLPAHAPEGELPGSQDLAWLRDRYRGQPERARNDGIDLLLEWVAG